MGARVSRTDYEWSYTDEPHATRRKEMLVKYPQIKKLMGSDPSIKYKVFLTVAIQLVIAACVSQASWLSVVILAYCLSGTLNHSLMLAIHEISHNLAFGHSRPLTNRLLGFVANLPIGVPMSISFKKYHLDHHRYQGDETKDVDIPSPIEARFFTNTFSKLVWVICQPLLYTLRPLFINPKQLLFLDIVNLIISLTFNYGVYYFFGSKSLFYLIIGAFLGTGLHPMSGHFISEHYMFVKGQETYSYYGPLNYLTYNVGYHNEHHDFPSIPGSRLPQVKKIAPEYYDTLPSHSSWVKVIYNFIVDQEVGPFSRVRRKTRTGDDEKKNGHMTTKG